MGKMNDRNAQLRNALGNMPTKKALQEIQNLPKEDTVNHQGHAAYKVGDEERLVAMLNTLRIEPQFYRTESQQMRDVRDLVEALGMKDPYFVAQAIVWSRCLGEGMRSINHLAAALLSPFASGTEWGKRFYGLFDKKNHRGGCIFRVDDMTEIKDVYNALNKGILSNAMKKGFASVIENLDGYQLAKYKKAVLDITNLVHPNPEKSKATVTIDGEVYKVVDAIMRGLNVSADTWERANAEAGQIVAKAVKEGKINKAQAEKILAEAKADNWEGLLADGKLGVLAALRNIRNIMKNPRKDMIDNWCKLITNAELTRKALILPIHFDLAYEVIFDDFRNVDYANQVMQALQDGYNNSIPNLSKVLTGRTLVMQDCSGSMGKGYSDGVYPSRYGNMWECSAINKRCSYKAALITATIAKATHADIIQFGRGARDVKVKNYNVNVFALAHELNTSDMGGTNPASAFEKITYEGRVYDRIIFVSDNEINGKLTSDAYKKYLRIASPYVYGIDLAAYGTSPLKNEGKVAYFFGYGPSLYEQIYKNEFNPAEKMAEIRSIVI